ncbi:unnamed protein product, partial [Musa acuminata subsp. burmannicoides]
MPNTPSPPSIKSPVRYILPTSSSPLKLEDSPWTGQKPQVSWLSERVSAFHPSEEPSTLVVLRKGIFNSSESSPLAHILRNQCRQQLYLLPCPQCISSLYMYIMLLLL